MSRTRWISRIMGNLESTSCPWTLTVNRYVVKSFIPMILFPYQPPSLKLWDLIPAGGVNIIRSRVTIRRTFTSWRQELSSSFKKVTRRSTFEITLINHRIAINLKGGIHLEYLSQRKEKNQADETRTNQYAIPLTQSHEVSVEEEKPAPLVRYIISKSW